MLVDGPNVYNPSDDYDSLIRRCQLYEALQRTKQTALWQSKLYDTHDPLLPGHPGGRQMFETMGELYDWSHIAIKVSGYVERWPHYKKHRWHPTHQRLLNLFFPKGSMEFIAIDILGPLPRTKSSNWLVVVIEECYPNLARAISTRRSRAARIAEKPYRHE